MSVSYWPTVVVVAAVAAMNIWRWRRKPAAPATPPPKPPGPLHLGDGPPDKPIGFGFKTAWIAVRTPDPASVIAALKLENVRAVGWPEGVARAYAHNTDPADTNARELFATPAIDGWVLAVGRSIPWFESEDHGGDAVSPFLRRIGAELATTVQYFGTHRITEYQAWARAEKGQVLRAFCYVGERGEVLVNVGSPTPEEMALHLPGDTEEEMTPSEEDVVALAGKWSVDPTMLDERPTVGMGWVGWLPK